MPSFILINIKSIEQINSSFYEIEWKLIGSYHFSIDYCFNITIDY